MSANCSCGAVVPEGSQFCQSCGKPVGQVTPSSPQGISASSGGLSQSAAGGLAYITIIPAIIFLLMEPYNRNSFIRFHAWQSIFLGIAALVLGTGFSMMYHLLWFLGFLLFPVSMLVDIGFFAVWLVCLIKAFSGGKFKLPLIGGLAQQQAGD